MTIVSYQYLMDCTVVKHMFYLMPRRFYEPV